MDMPEEIGRLVKQCMGFAVALTAMGGAAIATEPSKAALIRDALSAAPPSIAATATVMDWDHTVLRQGSGNYTCHRPPPPVRKKGGKEPMCLDDVWLKWADAWLNKKPFKADRVGVAYMLAGE